MSVARHLHTPPQPRSEVDVAADAIVAILDARIVPRTPGMIGRLSMATGVPVAMIKKAWELKEAGYGGLQPTRRPIAEQPAPVPNPKYDPKAKAANERKRAKKEPVARYEAVLGHVQGVEAEVGVQHQEQAHWPAVRVVQVMHQGLPARAVDECREDQAPHDSAALRVCEENHLELHCVTCLRPIKVGQEVVADDVKLCHATCST
jgi:hypothetical protein